VHCGSSPKRESSRRKIAGGLQQPLLPGHHDPDKPVQEVVALPRDRKGLMRPVGERIQLQVPSAQFVQYGHAGRQRAAQHFVPARAIGRDQPGMLRVLRAERGDRLVPAAACILLLVPPHGADFGQEALHRRLVAEQPATQVARVPVDQHPAQIEHHRVETIARCVHGRTSPAEAAVSSNRPATAASATGRLLAWARKPISAGPLSRPA